MSQTRSPRVTVVMPAYNAERFIDEAIRSIRDQTLSDWELLIVNDGSTDNTADIAERHAKDDPRIRVLHQENAGQAAANNHAIPQARAELIARMDADDVSLPDRLHQQVRFLDQHPEIAAVGAGMELMDEAGQCRGKIAVRLTPTEVRRAMLLQNRVCIANPTVMFRRTRWTEVGGERSCFMSVHDNDLWYRIVERHSIAVLPDCHVRYRLHQKNISLTAIESQGLCLLGAAQSMVARRDENNDPFEGRKAPIDLQFLTSLGCTPTQCETAILDCIGGQIAISIAAGCGDRACALIATLRQRRLNSPAPESQSFHEFVADMRMAAYAIRQGRLPLSSFRLVHNWVGAIEVMRRLLTCLRNNLRAKQV